MVEKMRTKKNIDSGLVVDPDRIGTMSDECFEYRTFIGKQDADLSEFGRAGWELISVINIPGDRATFYFKRKAAS